MSCHQNQEKEASPSMAWHRTHCQVTSNHPKPFPSPSLFPPTADSSFLPSSLLRAHIPQKVLQVLQSPHPHSLVLLWAAIFLELRTHCHHPCKSLGWVRCSRQPSFLPCTPTDPGAPNPRRQHQKFTPSPHHTIKRDTEAPLPLKSSTPP